MHCNKIYLSNIIFVLQYSAHPRNSCNVSYLPHVAYRCNLQPFPSLQLPSTFTYLEICKLIRLGFLPGHRQRSHVVHMSSVCVVTTRCRMPAPIPAAVCEGCVALHQHATHTPVPYTCLQSAFANKLADVLGSYSLLIGVSSSDGCRQMAQCIH